MKGANLAHGQPSLTGGDLNVCLGSPDLPTRKRFVALWERSRFLRPGHSVGETANQHAIAANWTPSCSMRHWSLGNE